MPVRLRSAASKPAAATSGDTGWEDAPLDFTSRSCHVNIYGDTGTGRTRLALTMPGPIALAHTNEKIDGLIQQFAREKKIKVFNFGGSFRGSPEAISNQAQPIWSRMSNSWYDAVDNWARCVVMDTETEGWELLRLARFGELNPQGRTESLYGPVNAEWISHFKRHKMLPPSRVCSIVSISQSKDEYKDVTKNGRKSSERTGNTIRAGQKGIPFAADVIIRTSKRYDREKGTVFTATVEKGWWNALSEGTEFENDDCRLPYILALITETEEEEWL